jgi:2-polyprenyl-6-methoxyphenol hydroxylase-like FAD-dependent oxidoreductase
VSNRRPHVLIPGAGIGGLSAALALLQRGFDVDVYEQAPRLEEVGAGVQLSPNATRALHSMGVLEALERSSCTAEGKEVRHWQTGETWKLFDLGAEAIERYGFPYLTVWRPDLLETLAAAVRRAKPEAIHLGSRGAGFARTGERVSLLFDDGREAAGDVLIGADGVHSQIRRALFGAEEPLFSGMIAWRGVVPMARLPRHMARMVGTNWVGPGGHVVHYPLHRGGLMNFVGIVERSDWRVESWSTQGSAAECAVDFAGWHEDVHRLIDNAPSLYKWALLVREPMERWTDGRVTLLGDACHPTLPMLAQGAVMAIEDGFILARCVERWPDNVVTALDRYERARCERTRAIVLGSAANARRFHNPALADPVGAKEYLDREWSRAAITSRYEWLFTYDVLGAVI